ncbi:MAG TPA: class II fructose-bisphosphate aldolase [Armatimonadetes bacterium]|nr:class II fructose-bisphosphate aldolase [Armatimonadota bacterium]
MALVTSKELMEAAAKEPVYAVGAFNAVNLETAQAIFTAAEEARSPLIIQFTQTSLGYTEVEGWVSVTEELIGSILSLARRASVPVAVHLDHGRSEEVAARFMDLGFSSVMIDGSLDEKGKAPRSAEENLAVTKAVVEKAHAKGISVEGEIGLLGQVGEEIPITPELEEKLSDPTKTAKLLDETAGPGYPGWPAGLTRPDEAAQFVEQTGLDLLAVGIGTKHGVYKGKPFIAHGLLQLLREALPVPLVMHGGTGVPDKDVTQGVQEGIRKINIDTQMRIAFYSAINRVMGEMNALHNLADITGETRKYDIRKVLAPAREAVKEQVINRMKVFGCAGRAF